ncbi:hypothetical protein RFI_04597 [Reticulomyxa filosa]|uniref:Uncharacterized protein n=1 Tax=Reticulomyxa filosa TaxID=46433 RepID=X6P1V2_RETFI|nr:hypothetical protein RFI_04597 [Reticulomyxa filosa]|eukprot:ETO32520.1 hypothetical protein RFI_04597 [Reticulomyxa filosa]
MDRKGGNILFKKMNQKGMILFKKKNQKGGFWGILFKKINGKVIEKILFKKMKNEKKKEMKNLTKLEKKNEITQKFESLEENEVADCLSICLSVYMNLTDCIGILFDC